MASTFKWRTFQFFVKEQLTEEGTKDPLNAFTDFSPSCSTSGLGFLIFGDDEGDIRIFNRDFEPQKFQACEGKGKIIALHQLKRQNILVSVGDIIGNTCIKIWKLDKMDSEGNPLCTKTIHVFSKAFPQSVDGNDAQVTCFAVLEDLSQLAVGLSNGAVMLFDGYLLRPHVRQSILMAEGPCVTGLHFREGEPKGSFISEPSLFVVTTKEVITIHTKARDKTKIVIDEDGGCDINCSVINEQKQLVVAREPDNPMFGVFFYEQEEKSICYGLEGDKKRVGWFNNYLYLVCEIDKGSAKSQLTVFDLRNKFIAFSARLDMIQDIVSEWGSLFVVTKTKKVIQLTEKDLKTKMEMLFKKHLYSIAVSLANSQDCGKAYVMEIFQMYGDHLYSKGDYDAAMQQYLETIMYVEPSYVIRKFLDAQRIHNLTAYLQALHDEGIANTEHTTLLLNCYTKLKDVKQLDIFIREGSDKKFDVETAITVLRQASYFRHALYLAQKHKRHSLYLKIQLEDIGDVKRALAYVRSMDFFQCESYVKLYGKVLIEHLTDETTQLIKELCVDYSSTPFEPEENGVEENRERDDSEQKHDKPEQYEEGLVQKDSFKEEPISNVKANPTDFIHLFVGRPDHLQDLLEHVSKEIKCDATVYDALIEGYLRQKKEGKKFAHAKIMALLKSKDPYDHNHALVLCKMYDFEKGVLFILSDKLHLYHEILQYHMDRDKHQAVLSACEKYGDNDKDPTLWTAALSYFAGKNETCEEEIREVLKNIQRHGLLPPLRVIQILSTNGNKPLSVVKDYIIQTLKEENDVIAKDQDEIQRYRETTRKMRDKIRSVKTKSTTFQGIRCHACPNALNLPAVHFLCMHSFHQGCVADGEKECPTCAPEYRKVKEMRENMKASSSQHDQFFKKLGKSPDGFEYVATYFGRGMFDRKDGPPETSR